MGVYRRPDSKFWWLWLETAPKGQQRVNTKIVIGTTVGDRKESRRLADAVYHKRMNALAARLHELPEARPVIRFAAYADIYEHDTTVHHSGAEREREILAVLRASLVDDDGHSEWVHAIDRGRTKQYMTDRVSAKVSPRTVNREVDVLKSMLRDAAPKYLTASPLVGMKRLRAVTPKRRLLTAAELDRLLAHATPIERALLLLGYDGLIREGNILDVRRADRRGAWLYIADPKGGEPYEVALTPRALGALQRLERDMPLAQVYYFERYRGAVTARDRRARVRRVLMKLCRKARVPYGRAKGGITFHWATRRSGATRLVIDRKQPIPAVQAQGNWKRADVLMDIYTEASRRQQRAAILTLRSRPRKRVG